MIKLTHQGDFSSSSACAAFSSPSRHQQALVGHPIVAVVVSLLVWHASLRATLAFDTAANACTRRRCATQRPRSLCAFATVAAGSAAATSTSTKSYCWAPPCARQCRSPVHYSHASWPRRQSATRTRTRTRSEAARRPRRRVGRSCAWAWSGGASSAPSLVSSDAAGSVRRGSSCRLTTLLVALQSKHLLLAQLLVLGASRSLLTMMMMMMWKLWCLLGHLAACTTRREDDARDDRWCRRLRATLACIPQSLLLVFLLFESFARRKHNKNALVGSVGSNWRLQALRRPVVVVVVVVASSSSSLSTFSLWTQKTQLFCTPFCQSLFCTLFFWFSFKVLHFLTSIIYQIPKNKFSQYVVAMCTKNGTLSLAMLEKVQSHFDQLIGKFAKNGPSSQFDSVSICPIEIVIFFFFRVGRITKSRILSDSKFLLILWQDALYELLSQKRFIWTSRFY